MRQIYAYMTIAILISGKGYAIGNQEYTYSVDTAFVEHHTIWSETNQKAWQNPAVYGSAYSTSLTQLSLSGDYRKQSSAFLLQEGTGHFLANIKAETYLRLSEKTTVWGEASYSTGKKYNITWNSTADASLLYPYIQADQQGGDTQTEQYRFFGGYSSRLGQWRLGGEMKFRAEQTYRDIDPRMRAIVNDLTLKAGATYTLKNYILGATLLANIYKQTNDITLYREAGGVTQYIMTGLGSHYERFADPKPNIYYKGAGANMALDLQPVNQCGWFAHLSLGKKHYQRIMASLNSLPITTLYNQNVEVMAGWKHTGHHDLAVFSSWTFTKRIGDEHVAGIGSLNVYPIICDLTQYKNYTLNSYVSTLYGKANNWHAQVKIGFLSNRERYVYPERQLNISYLYGEVKAQKFYALSKCWTLSSELSGLYMGNTDSKIVMPYANMEEIFINMVDYNYNHLTADYLTIGLKVRASYRLNADSHQVLFAELGGHTTHCSLNENEMALRLSIGITF